MGSDAPHGRPADNSHGATFQVTCVVPIPRPWHRYTRQPCNGGYNCEEILADLKAALCAEV